MSRKTGSVLVGVVVVLLAGLVAFNLLVPPPTVEQVKADASAVVGAVVGEVQLRRHGTKRWETAVIGTGLSEGDEVRTGLFAEATLHLRGASSVSVAANTNFVVGQEQISRSSFELAEGRIVAAIPEESSREFEFRSRGSEAVASAERGEFAMVTDGKGTVVVDARKGTVKLRAKGKEVKVSKGTRSVVAPNKPPADALPVPASVALQVRWPPIKTDQTQARLVGKTESAATVMINGIQVRADDQGAFSIDVPLREGSNHLVVSTTDVSGNTTVRKSPEIRVDTRPPDLKVDAEGLWK
jgi:hypothetical protein